MKKKKMSPLFGLGVAGFFCAAVMAQDQQPGAVSPASGSSAPEPAACEAAMDAKDSRPGTILRSGSATVLLKAWDAPNEWEVNPPYYLSGLLTYRTANADVEDRFLICLRERAVWAFTYNNGVPAYRIDAQIRVVAWPSRAVVASKDVRGDDPPTAIISSQSRIYAPSPRRQMRNWVYELWKDTSLLKHDVVINAGEVSFDGRSVVTVSHTDMSIHHWDTASGAHTRSSFGTTSETAPLKCSGPQDGAIERNGQYVAFLASAEGGSCVKVWALTPSFTPLWSGVFPLLTSLTFTPGGENLVLGSRDGQIRFVDASSGSLLMQAHAWNASVHRVIALDSDRLALAGCPGLAIWSKTEGLLRQFIPSADKGSQCVNGLSYAESTNELAAVTWPTVTVFPLRPGGTIRTISAENSGSAEAVVFSSDGTRLAVEFHMREPDGNFTKTYDVTRIYDAAGNIVGRFDTRLLGLPVGATSFGLTSDQVIKVIGFR